ADCLSSIAMDLPAKSETDLISGRAMTIATSAATVIRSATAVAAVTCCCVDLVRESVATRTVGNESTTFAFGLSGTAAALIGGYESLIFAPAALAAGRVSGTLASTNS